MTKRWINDADALRLATRAAEESRERSKTGVRGPSWLSSCELVRSKLYELIEDETAPEAQFAALVEAAARLVRAADDVQREVWAQRRYDEHWD